MNYHLHFIIIFIFTINYGNTEELNHKYSTQYDNIDLDEILASERLLNGYIKCLLDKGSCTPDGKELKSNLPDAIQNDCQKCTEKQREGADKIMHYIIDHRPDDWSKLEEKYQSDGTYKRKYLEIENAVDDEEKTVENTENNGSFEKNEEE